MIDVPDIRYARSGDLHIAYQVVGEGELDVVHVPGLLNELVSAWEVPVVRRFHERLATFARVILLDKRGSGLSDRLAPDQVPTLEERADDVRAVLDAVGSPRAAVFAAADGGPVGILFAATQPARVSSLVLHDTAARVRWAPDYPLGARDDAIETMFAAVADEWGTGLTASAYGFGDEVRRQHARMEQLSGTPRAALAMWRTGADTDVRGVLGSLSLPVLVVHDIRSLLWSEAGARYLAEHIPGARLALEPTMLLPGFDAAAGDLLGALVEEFLTGACPSTDFDRVLTTVLFTDIVDSTGRAAELGDRRWKELLDSHDAAVRSEVERYRGTVVNTTGDGLFASFDGPARAIRCAQAISRSVQSLGLAVRAGLHIGECEVRGDDLAGIAVHIGARVAGLAEPGEVLCTSTLRDLTAGSGIEFEDRGRHELKGVPGEWQVLAVQE